MSIPHGALAAREGRIVWVGDEAAIGDSLDVAADALIVDAEGACVLPGFVDAHTHAVFAGERAGEYGRRLAGAATWRSRRPAAAS